MANPVRDEQQCWAKAVEIFNTELTRDSKKKIDFSDPQGKHDACSISDLVDAAQNGRAACVTRTPLLQRLERIIQVGNQYAPVVDVMVQNQPHITALVWGGIRLLIGVAVAEIETGEEIGEALDVIVLQIGRYQEEALLFSTVTTIQILISKIYAFILSYLVRATSYFSHSYAVRIGKAGFTTARTKLKHILCSIESTAVVLDREIRTASEAMHAKQRNVQLLEFFKQEEFRADMRAQEERREKVEQHRTTLQWFRDSSTPPQDIPERTHGTCGWIYDHPVYKEWDQSGYSGCLLIQGISGSGKSVLATYLAETADTKPYVLTHFFRNYVDRQSARGISFALSLLTKLFETKDLVEDTRFPPLLAEMLPFCQTYKASRDCPLKQLLSKLDKLLDLVPPFTLLVDALDECNDIKRESDPLVKYLLDLGARPYARVILFSRQHARFDKMFKNSFKLLMDQSIVQSDISLFLKQRILTLQLENLEETIMEKASSDCQGMFQWAKMMVEHVEEGMSVNARRRRLREFPRGLFAAYEQLLEENDNRLSDEEKDVRCNVFHLLVGAHEVLTVHEISAALALNAETSKMDENDTFINPEDAILNLCWPLAMVVNGKAQLIHMTVKEFLLESTRRQHPAKSMRIDVSLEYSDSILAEKTLAKLTQSQYRSWKCSAGLLRKHLLSGINVAELPGINLAELEECTYKESLFYNYSCLHWHDHLTELDRPSETILALLARFLVGNELVTWSEVLFDLKELSGISTQIEVRAKLQVWYKEKLLPELRCQVPINVYFEESHELLNKELVKVSEDKLLPFLPLIRLGDYYNVGGENPEEWQKGYEYKDRVAEGYEDLLGKRNPVTLRAKTSLYQEYFWLMRIDEAETGLLDVCSIQREVLQENDPDYFATLYLLGSAQFHLNKFVESCSTLGESAKGLRKSLGKNNAKAFMADLFNGYALEAQGKLDLGYCLYKRIWVEWTQITSEEHPLSLMVQTAMGSIYRKQRHFAKAGEALESSWTARKRLFSVENNVSADSGIQLAIYYRDSGQNLKAKKLLDEVSRSIIFPEDFERDCQIIHIRALLAFDDGEYERAKLSLLHLLDRGTGSHRDRNNRELLWVRVTLADAMRHSGEGDTALMLFAELVKPIEDGSRALGSLLPLDEEPEPPSQLRIAEKALRYLKAANQQAAADILEQNKLQWARLRDFWIQQGGPIADTACMEGPRLALERGPG